LPAGEAGERQGSMTKTHASYTFDYPPFKDNELIRLQEVGLLFGICIADAIEWAARHDLPATRITEDDHQTVRYRVSDLLEWARRKLEASPEIAEALVKSGFVKKITN